MRIIELDGFNGNKIYIFVSHMSSITKNEQGKGTQIYIDSSETPFYVTEDVETVLWKIKASIAEPPKEDEL